MNKLIQFFLSFLIVATLPTLALAQIDLNDAGRVGIGASPNSNNQLRVIASSEEIAIFGRSANTSNAFNYGIRGEAANGEQSYGLYGKANGAIINYGVYGTTTSASLFSRGIYASASGGNSNNYGIYATASGSNSWAGYFSGSEYTTGSYQSSDARLKKNIKSLREEGVLARLTHVDPKRYQYLSDEELRNSGLPSMHAKPGNHFGLIAQELEKVYPELVTDVVHVLGEDSGEIGEGSQTVVTKAVNYQELTVLLLAAVQELQAEIKALKTQLNLDKER